MIRYDNESFISFADRTTQALLNGIIGYDEWAEELFGDILYSEETLRRCSKCIAQFLNKINEDKYNEYDDDRISEILRAKADLEKERQKFFDEKREIKETIRWQSRNEMFQERILSAVNKLDSLDLPKIEFSEYERVNTTALIAMSDFHAGSTFEVKGLYGETVNKYDFDIMVSRMWKLLHDFAIESDMVYDDIVVSILGDCFENILRLSSLAKLKEPVIDTVIKFSEVMAKWLSDLYKITKVPIKVITVGGNHDTQRILGSKPSLEDENLTKIVVEFLKLRFKDCKYIKINDYTDIAVENIRGTSVAFQHGEDKDLQTTIDYFSNLYNMEIDEILAGHLHRPESRTIGITEIGDRVVTRIGSIVGTDTFAKKIRVSARPSAYVAMYTDEGKTWSRNYYL